MDVRTLLETLILIIVCAIGASVLQQKKKALLAVITDLVQKAETVVEGTKMGQDKKDKVTAQLEAMGYKMTTWTDKAIDDVVAMLNDKKGWLVTKAASCVTGWEQK